MKLLRIRIENLIYLLTPYELLSSEGGQAIAKRLWALNLFSIPGALGIGLIAPLYIAIIKNLREKTLWILALVPVLLCVIVIGWPKGLGALHFAEAIVVLLTGLAIGYLLNLRRKFWLFAAYILNVAELIFFTGYSYKFATGAWFKGTADLVLLLIMLGTVTLCGWLIYRAAYNKNVELV